MFYDTTIVGVTSRTVNRKSDGKTITIFEIADSNGTTWTTSRRDLATEANRLLNQAATVQGREEQKGTYLNHYLEDVRQANGSPVQAQTAPLPPPSTPPPPPIPTAPPRASQEGDEKQQQIHRQTAAKVSSRLSSTPAEFWSNVDDLVAYFNTGNKPNVAPEAIRQNTEAYKPFNENEGVTSNANQFVPAGYVADPGPQSTREFSDDDIPF